MTTYAITKIWRPHPESDYHEFKLLGLSTQEQQCLEFIARLRVEDARLNLIIESVNKWRDNYYEEHPRPELMDRPSVRAWRDNYRQAYQEKFDEFSCEPDSVRLRSRPSSCG